MTAGDVDLILQVARGDSGPLRLLYESHARSVLAIAMRILRVPSDAEEIVQETFVEVWRRAREFDPGRGSVGSWIATIARTRAIDRRRSHASAARAVEGAAAQAPLAPGPAGPEAAASANEERKQVVAALRGLPAEQRAVLELSCFEGLSHSEIAARTGAPLGTVKTRVRLALEKVGAALKRR